MAAKARQHLQDMKEKVNLSNLARQKGLDNIRRLLAQRKDVFCDEVDHTFEEDVDISHYTLSGLATQELSLEGNEGIYNSSLDWLPISYNRQLTCWLVTYFRSQMVIPSLVGFLLCSLMMITI